MTAPHSDMPTKGTTASDDDGCPATLTLEELQKLLAGAKAFENYSRNEAQKKLRQSSRTALRMSVRATIYSPPECPGDTARVCHLLAQDVSATGISIIHARPFSVGQRIDLELPDGCRSAVVCRTSALSDGHYLCGCQFAA